MISRSLMILGLGVALAVGGPAASFAQQAKKPQETASVAKKPVVKKTAKKPVSKKAAAKAGSKKVAKTAKGKGKPEAEVAEEKPKGLFASLFGPPKGKAEKVALKTDKTKASRQAAKDAKSKKPVQLAAADVDKRRPSGGFWLFGAPSTPEEPRSTGRLRPLNPITPVESTAASVGSSEIVASGNNGELRSGSGNPAAGSGFMASVFGAEDQYLPETRALDSAMRVRTTPAAEGKKKNFQVAEKWQPQLVDFSGYPRGTIVIDTGNHFLYLVESWGTARRYGIAVGKEGLQYKGTVKVGDKQEWPRWIPTKEMIERDPKSYAKYSEGMPGGGMNPLGARAIYLYQGKKDTYLRIHGTIAPQTIGTNASNGCFRMVNEHVMDLYRRVPVGANVVVM